MHKWTWWGNLRERGNFEVPDVNGRIILECIFRKYVGGGGGEKVKAVPV